ncbi:NAD(P)/FAD-dependent oxidoreductase [Brevibacillus sp. NRS-1366]|uniref:NAD(P)/FAD-dependent oxidoreductase n=1 Tax=Brevibacillus sp. NRS-1366 TaxID=3233899 RepID=UPI003D1EFF7A
MKEDQQVYDITIIGGGPVGLFTAFYGGMRQCSVKIIESMPQLGGQLSALYPEKFIYDVAGFPKIRAQELVDRLKKQAFHFDPTICLEEKVLDVCKNQEEIFELTTDKAVHFSKTVIITAGAGAFQPRRLEHVNARDFERSNLHYFARDMKRFAGKTVLVAGGGDSALDWALMLEPIAKKVVLVHRRDKFRAHEHSISLLEKSTVVVKTSVEISALEGLERVELVRLIHQVLEEEEVLEVDEMIVSYGFVSSIGPIKEWGLQVEKGSIVINSRGETNISGIYAAGDIATYPGKVKLIASGFGEGPTAVNNAKAYMDPESRLQPAHSTSMNF